MPTPKMIAARRRTAAYIHVPVLAAVPPCLGAATESACICEIRSIRVLAGCSTNTSRWAIGGVEPREFSPAIQICLEIKRFSQIVSIKDILRDGLGRERAQSPAR